MIYTTRTRGINILTFNVTNPNGYRYGTYTVSVSDLSNPVFEGRISHVMATHEIDVSDWIDQYITRAAQNSYTTFDCTVSVVLRLYTAVSENPNITTKTVRFTPEVISLDTYTPTGLDTYAFLNCYYTGFKTSTGSAYILKVPLQTRNGMLVGKTTNKITKVGYKDRYDDEHNSIATNKIELECYVDPDWIGVKTTADHKYEQVMLALQVGRSFTFEGNVGISGLTGLPLGTIPGHVKTVEEVITYSQYSTEKRLTYKIIFEIAR